MLVRKDVIISPNKILYLDLMYNLADQHSFFILQSCNDIINFLRDNFKINILIIDDKGEYINSCLQISQNVINLTNNIILANSIALQKPFKFIELIDIITSYRKNQKFFCNINKDIIYDSYTATVKTKTQQVMLTDKENKIFETLLFMEGYKVTKESLLEIVWSYSKNIRTQTLETHIYNLKQKLPYSLIVVNNQEVSLNIDYIE